MHISRYSSSHETVVSVLRLPHTQFHAAFVCNFLSSSAGFNLCSCFFRLTLAFWLSLSGFSGLNFFPLSLLSVDFLTSAVSAFLSIASVLDSDYSASVSSFPHSSRPRLTVAYPVRPFRFRFLAFPRSSQPGFPCFLSRFFVLGVLFVSFRPSRLRSHSCFTGASLLFRFRIFSGIFCLLSGFFRPLQPASDYSAFCTFFSLLPVFPWQRF